MDWELVLIVSLGFAGLITLLMACDWLSIDVLTGRPDDEQTAKREH